MKTLYICTGAFVVGMGIAALTQYPVLETLGYLPDSPTEVALESSSLTGETDSVETSLPSEAELPARPEKKEMAKAKPAPRKKEMAKKEMAKKVERTSDRTVAKGSVTKGSSTKGSETKRVEAKGSTTKELASKNATKGSTSKRSMPKGSASKNSAVATSKPDKMANKPANKTTTKNIAQPDTGNFERDVYTHEGFDLPYRILRPRVAGKTNQKFPLIVFLHGAGERGTDNEAQLKHGAQQIEAWMRKNGKAAYVLVPQCPEDDQWTDLQWSETKHEMPAKPTKSMGAVLGLLDDLMAEEPIDEKRVTTTGLSMGGYGVYDLVARRPNVFAAAAPLCGGADCRPESIKKLASTPMYIVHGSKDSVVSVENSRNVVAALEEQDVDPIYIELRGMGHDCWTKTYANDTIMNWLYTKRKWPAGKMPKVTLKSKAAPKPGAKAVAKKSKNVRNSFAKDQDPGAEKEMASNRAPSLRKPVDRTPVKSNKLGTKVKPNQPKRIVVSKPPIKEAAKAEETIAEEKQSSLIGKWNVTRAKFAGKEIPFDKLKAMSMAFDGEQISIVQGGKREVADFESGEVQQIGDSSVAELKITSAGGARVIRGFYYFDADELTMIWGAPGEKRPDPTKPEENAKARVLTLEAAE